MASSAKRAPPTIAFAGLPASARQATATSARAWILLGFGRTVAADSRLETFLIDRNRGPQHITICGGRDNEDPCGRSAYDAAARSMPAEFGISTSISKVETLSPRSIRT